MQAKAFASQYQPNTQVKGSAFDQMGGTTSGGALGGDVTGKPMWGNPVSADSASSSTGRTEHNLMAIGDYSYDNKGAVFVTRRQPMGDYLRYFDRWVHCARVPFVCMYMYICTYIYIYVHVYVYS